MLRMPLLMLWCSDVEMERPPPGINFNPMPEIHIAICEPVIGSIRQRSIPVQRRFRFVDVSDSSSRSVLLDIVGFWLDSDGIAA
jgi:hypothetical protein